jgi:hypothetical protein
MDTSPVFWDIVSFQTAVLAQRFLKTTKLPKQLICESFQKRLGSMTLKNH